MLWTPSEIGVIVALSSSQASGLRSSGSQNLMGEFPNHVGIYAGVDGHVEKSLR